MRTAQEIKTRFESSGDLFGTQKSDLIEFMEYEDAKPYLKEDYIALIEKWEEKWEKRTEAKQLILDYMAFAYDKAESQRGLSAGRSMLHFRTWIWIDDPIFYEEIISDIDNYTDYWIPTLDKIAAHYGYNKS